MMSEELSGETYDVEGPIPIIPRDGSAYRARRPTQIKYPVPLGVFNNSQRRTEFLSLRLGITRAGTLGADLSLTRGSVGTQVHLYWMVPPALQFPNNNRR